MFHIIHHVVSLIHILFYMMMVTLSWTTVWIFLIFVIWLVFVKALTLIFWIWAKLVVYDLNFIGELNSIVTTFNPRCFWFGSCYVLHVELSLQDFLIYIWNHVGWFHEREGEGRFTVEVSWCTLYLDLDIWELGTKSSTNWKWVNVNMSLVLQ